MFQVLNELKEADAMGRTARDARRAHRVPHWAIAGAGMLYMWLATFGYLTFGEEVEINLWDSYASRDNTFISFARAGFFVAIVLTVPLIAFPMRKAISELLCATLPPLSPARTSASKYVNTC